MTQGEVKSKFISLQPEQQLFLLALLAHNVTIAARSACVGPVEVQLIAEKLRAFNEVLHTITGQLMNLMLGKPNRYPNDEFIDALFEKAQHGDCGKDLIDAFAWSYSATSSSF